VAVGEALEECPVESTLEMYRIAHDVAGMLYSEASTAVMNKRLASGMRRSERRIRMSCWYDFGRGFAKGKREEHFRGDDTRTCRWNSRVPATSVRETSNASRKFMVSCVGNKFWVPKKAASCIFQAESQVEIIKIHLSNETVLMIMIDQSDAVCYNIG